MSVCLVISAKLMTSIVRGKNKNKLFKCKYNKLINFFVNEIFQVIKY